MFLWFWIFLFCTFVVLLFLMFCFLFWKLQTLIETQMIKKPKRKGDIRAKLSKKEWDWNLNRVINFETIITKNFELKVIMSSALDKSNCTEVPYGKAVLKGFIKLTGKQLQGNSIFTKISVLLKKDYITSVFQWFFKNIFRAAI